MRSLPPWPLTLCVLLSLSGAVLSGFLLHHHVSGKAPGGLLAAVCGAGGGCDAVLRSRWAVFPPAAAEGSDGAGSGPAGTSPGEAPLEAGGGRANPPERPSPVGPGGRGLSVAALGLFYFSSLCGWLIAVGRPDRSRFWLHRTLLALAATGSLASAGFIGLMAFAVKAWCALCLAAHLSNFLFLAVAFLLRPRDARPSRPYPDGRLALLGLALIALLVTAEWAAVRSLALAGEKERLRAQLEEVAEGVEALEMAYFSGEKHDITLRADDPEIAASPGVHATLVYFTDIECPACARFERFLFEEILPLFHGHLRVVFKHLPLRSLHPHAPRAARALEAARSQGKFWEMHRLLLEHRLELGSVEVFDLAGEIGLDVLVFLEDLYSEEVWKRVEEDMGLAARLGVDSTPAVFLNGRRVKLGRDLLGFWKLRAESVRRSREVRGQPW